MEKVKVQAYIKDNLTGKYVLNVVTTTPVVELRTEEIVEEIVVEEVVANAEESANENVTTEAPVKKAKAKKKK
jgi:hypothetical protein